MSQGDDDDGIALVVPPLGEGVTEGVVTTWIARPGDQVTQDQTIVSISLDKVDVELQAPASGVLVARHAANDVVKIGEVIARIVPAPPPELAAEAQHDALLAAIAQAPEDENLRQVYADFLLEAACPLGTWGAETTALRGEYLGLVARLRRPHPDDDVAALTRRRDELEPVARATAISLVQVEGKPHVEDGFVVGFETSLATLVADHARLFSRAPLHSLGVWGLGADAADQLLAVPRLEQLTQLSLDGARGTVAPHVLSRIASSPRLAGLRRLKLVEAVCDLGDRAFERLVIVGTNRWHPEPLRAAIARPLRELSLVGHGPPPSIAGANPGRLELTGYELDARWPAALGALTDLVRLELQACTFRERDDLLATIAALPPTLGVLVLQSSRVGPIFVAHLADELRELTSAAIIF